jgi:hypothetical protein
MSGLSDRIDMFADDGPEASIEEVVSAEDDQGTVPGADSSGAGAPVDDESGTDSGSDDDDLGAGDGDDDQPALGQESEPAGAAGAGPVEVKPEAKFLIDGKEVTGEELLTGRLAHADYTRKTQALADARKTFEAKSEEHEDYRGDVQEYFQRTLSDPSELLNEYRASAPEKFQALKKLILDEAIRVGDMTEAEFAMYQEMDKSKHEDWKRGRLSARAKAAEERTTMRSQRAEIHRSVSNWRAEAMKGAGLSLDNQDHTDAFYEYMTSRHRADRWTEEMIQAAAKSVAKRFGVKPPKASAAPAQVKDPKTGKFVPAKPVQAPPPVRGLGTKRPPGKSDPTPKKVSTSTTFAALRERFGR